MRNQRLKLAGGAQGAHQQAHTALSADDFDTVCRSDWSTLVRLAWLLLGDRAAAEDTVQDACVKVYRRWASITDLPGAHAYLRTAVRNEARSAMRRRYARRRLNDHLAAIASEVSSPQDRVSDQISITAAVTRLPRRQREVVVLRYWLGLSETEIAEELGVSNGTVKSTAARALSRLHANVGGVNRDEL